MAFYFFDIVEYKLSNFFCETQGSYDKFVYFNLQNLANHNHIGSPAENIHRTSFVNSIY